MPISTFNYLGANTQQSVLGDLLGEAMAGYKASRMPAEQRMKEQQQSELIQQLQHGNYASGLKNQYLPGKLENEEALRDLNLRYAEPKAQAELSKSLLGNESQEMKNKIMREYGLNGAEADILYKRAKAEEAKAHAKHGHLAHFTPEQRNAAAAGYEPGSKEYQDIMKSSLGEFPTPKDEEGNPLPIPRHAISLIGRGAQERGHYETEMRKNVDRGESAKRADRELNNIINITKTNPKLNRSFSYIASDPELLNPSTWQKAIKGLNEKEQTQLDLLVKSTNKLVLAQEDASPGRGSDLRRKLQIAAKPGAGMTDEARIKIAESLKEENAPLIAYADEAAPFIGSYYIPYQAKNYSKKDKETSIEEAINRNGGSPPGGSTATVHIETDSGPYDIPLGQVDAFMMKRKDQNPRIVLGGSK